MSIRDRLRPPFPKDAVIMGYRASKSLRAFTAIGCAILVFGLGLSVYAGDFLDALGVTAILSGLLVLIHLQQFGYRVAYDDEAIYVRRWGIFNALNLKAEIASVRWNQFPGSITSIRQVFGRDLDWDYQPDEFLEIRLGPRAEDRLRVYPYMIDMDDFAEFANVFSLKVGKSIELEQ